MRHLFTLLVTFTPYLVFASDGNTESFSFAASLVKMIGSLLVVIGIISLFTYLTRRYLPSGLGYKRFHSNIRVVETMHIAPKKSLLLVEVAGEYLLLSNSNDGVSLIKQIDMLEELEVLEVIGEPKVNLKERFSVKLDSLLNKFPSTSSLVFSPRGQQ